MNIEKIILGTVQMGLAYGINNKTGKISIEESHAILMAAYQSGIRILDSAEAYGNAHEVIGSFHRLNPECKFQVITKMPHDINGDINERINRYLDELQVNSLYCLMFHAFKTYIDHRELIKTLLKLKADKKISLIGVSVYSNAEFAKAVEDDAVDVIQLPFNLLDNYQKRGALIKSAKSKGKVVHTRSAFLQGLFFKSPEEKHKITDALSKELDMLHLISRRENIDISTLALNYCLQQGNIDNVLIGVDSLEQLRNNVSIISNFISDSVIKEVNNINVENIDLLNPSLWN